MIQIVRLSRTSLACPTQWEGQTACGREVYVRYRWGKLEIWVWDEGGDITDGELLFEGTVGKEFDGTLTYGELLGTMADLDPMAVGWPHPVYVDDPFTRDDLVGILTKAAEAITELIEEGSLRAVSLEELHADPDVTVLTSDKLQLEEGRARGDKIMSHEEFDILEEEDDGNE